MRRSVVYLAMASLLLPMTSCEQLEKRLGMTEEQPMEEIEFVRGAADQKATPEEDKSMATPIEGKQGRPKDGLVNESSDDDDFDNMRGFDPASEDDTDDGGVARYMDNNDGKGWE